MIYLGFGNFSLVSIWTSIPWLMVLCVCTQRTAMNQGACFFRVVNILPNGMKKIILPIWLRVGRPLSSFWQKRTCLTWHQSIQESHYWANWYMCLRASACRFDWARAIPIYLKNIWLRISRCMASDSFVQRWSSCAPHTDVSRMDTYSRSTSSFPLRMV